MSGPLVVRRIIRADRRRVFAAFVQPDELRKWWGPSEIECCGAEVDPRLGGRYRIDNRLPDGSIVVIQGEFTDFQPPVRLAYTWSVASNSCASEHVLIEFEAVNVGTRVTVTHERITDDDVRRSHQSGWTGCLRSLIEYLE